MGYESGRTGDQTKILLNKVDNHALYKGAASLNNDTQASIAANALVVGIGNGCEITDEIADSSLRGNNAIVNISATGKAILAPVNGQIVTTEGDQTISSVKKITSTFNNGIGKLEIGKIEGSGAPGNYYKRGTLTATENGLLKWTGNGTYTGLTLTADSAGSNQFTISETYGYAPSLNLQWFGMKDGTTHTYVSYIDFPGDKGTSSSHETLACLSDIPSVLGTGASNQDKYLHTNASTGELEWATISSGDVVGPDNSSNNALVVFDGTTGKQIKQVNSGVTLTSGSGGYKLSLGSNAFAQIIGGVASTGIEFTGGTLPGVSSGYYGVLTPESVTATSGSRENYLGSSSKPWTGLVLSSNNNFIKTTANNNYGLTLPDTTQFSASKTIATTDDLTGFVTGPSSGTTDNTIALFDGTTGKIIKSASNISIDNATAVLSPTLSSLGSLGSSSKKWGSVHTQILTVYTRINSNSSNKGLVLPDTTSYTADKTIATTEDCTKLYKHTLTVFTSGPKIVIINNKSDPYTDINSIAMNRQSMAMTNCFDCYGDGLGHIECITVTDGYPGSTVNLYGYGFSNDVPTFQCIFTGTRPDSSTTAITDVVTPL